MKDKINHLVVDIFNNVMDIEEHALKNGPFHDLSIKEIHTLEAVGLHEKKTMSLVAKTLHITMGTLTVAVDQLERKGYVKRIRDEKDRRIYRLSLTKKGRDLYRVHDKFHKVLVSQLLKGLSDVQMSVLEKSLSHMQQFLQELQQ